MKALTKRRPLLIAAVVALVAANALWFGLRRDAEPKAAFTFADATEYGGGGPLQASGGRTDLEAAPYFEPVTRSWLIAGNPVSDLRPYMKTMQAGYAANDTAPFLLVRLPATATTEDVRKALLNLTQRTICLVALSDENDPQRVKGTPAVAVRRIVSVLDDSGKAVACPAPHNPFAASSASR